MEAAGCEVVRLPALQPGESFDWTADLVETTSTRCKRLTGHLCCMADTGGAGGRELRVDQPGDRRRAHRRRRARAGDIVAYGAMPESYLGVAGRS
jgi:hypothetical protein